MRRGIRPFSDSSGGELQAPLAREDTMDEPINYTRCSTCFGKRNTSAPTRGTTEPEVDSVPGEQRTGGRACRHDRIFRS